VTLAAKGWRPYESKECLTVFNQQAACQSLAKFLFRTWLAQAAGACLLFCSGCFAPLHYHGIPANTLPEDFRMPWRTARPSINYASLTLPPQGDYILGPGDILEVNVNGLYPGGEIHPVRVQVLANGEISLPVVGSIRVGRMNVAQANAAITKAYANGFIKDSRVNVLLVEKATVGAVVLGAVQRPGVYPLTKYENDVAHALALAGGLREDAGDVIEIHRRIGPNQIANAQLLAQLRSSEGGSVLINGSPPEKLPGTASPNGAAIPQAEIIPGPGSPIIDCYGDAGGIVRICLRGMPVEPMDPNAIALQPGDVIVVPSKAVETFYVVGKLNANNTVRFSLGVKERELGNALVLPPNREVDVVTAVAMAGYIDPIDSPTTVSVQRMGPDGTPVVILVDLIRARYDRRETVLIQPGDIVYLNPDCAWWTRRTFDAIIRNIISIRLTHSF
jgi:protein involved in polysaccharide export with SLBB domain